MKELLEAFFDVLQEKGSTLTIEEALGATAALRAHLEWKFGVIMREKEKVNDQ